MRAYWIILIIFYLVIGAYNSYAGEDVETCSGQSVQLVPEHTSANEYLWTPDSYLSNDRTQSPFASPVNTSSEPEVFTYSVACITGTDTVRETVSVTINPLPVQPDFTYSSATSGLVCSSEPLNFEVTNPNNDNIYIWRYAESVDTGTSVIGELVSVGSGIANMYVALTAENEFGCISSSTQNIPVYQESDNSLASYAELTTFKDQEVFKVCTNISTDLTFFPFAAYVPNNPTYELDWGDGSVPFTASAVWDSAVHRYNVGMYTLTYRTISDNGCVAEREFGVFVGSNPGVAIGNEGNSNICTNGSYEFAISSTENNTPGTFYLVEFGDGTDTLIMHPAPDYVAHTYRQTSCGLITPDGTPNAFYVKITASNPCDVQTGATTIKVSAGPRADFNVIETELCEGESLCFENRTEGAEITPSECVIVPQFIWQITSSTGYTLNAPDNLGRRIGSTWRSGTNTICPVFNEPGVYTVHIESENACGFDSKDTVICVHSEIIPNFIPSEAQGCEPLSISTQNTTGSASVCDNIDYLWDIVYTPSFCNASSAYHFGVNSADTSRQPSITFESAGTYTMQLSATNRCGTFTTSEDISVIGRPLATINPIIDRCGPAPLSVFPEATIINCGSSAIQSEWIFNEGIPNSFSGELPGEIIYNTVGEKNIVLQTTNECGTSIHTESFEIFENPSVNVGIDTSLCYGELLSLHALPENGTPPYAIWWVEILTSNNEVTFPVVASRDIHVQVSDSVGCLGYDTIAISAVPAPVFEVYNDTVCEGADATLSVMGTASFEWSNGESGSSIIVSPEASAYFMVTATENNCSDCTEVYAIVNPLPIVSASFFDTIQFCNQSIEQSITSGTPMGGVWSGAGITPDGRFTPPVTIETIELVYSYTNPITLCSNSDTVIAQIVAPEEVTVGNDFSICENSEFIELAGNSPLGGTWLGMGVFGNAFNPMSAGVGIHKLLYSYGQGSCLKSDSLNVYVLEPPVVEVNAVELCEGDTAVFFASGANSYVWEPSGFLSSDTGSTVHVFSAVDQSYRLIGTDTLTGCSDSSIAFVDVHALPVVNAGPDTVFCYQNIDVNIPNFVPSNAIWSGNAVTSDGRFNPYSAGQGVYSLVLSYTDNNSCFNSDTMIVSVEEPQTIILPNDTSLCDNTAPILLNASPAGGSWQEAGVERTSLFNPMLESSSVHQITYSYGQGSCEVSDIFQITVLQSPQINLTDATICEGDSVLLHVSGTDIYSWAPLVRSIDLNNEFVWAKPSVSTVYTVVGQNVSSSCSDTISATVAVNPLPIVDAGNDRTFCNQNIAVQLIAVAPNVGAVWSGNAVSPTGSLTPTDAGLGTHTVILTYTDAVGCTNRDSIEVSIVDATFANAGTGFHICIDAGEISLTGYSPAGGTWTGNALTGDIFNPALAGSGLHELTYSYGAGTCLTNDTIHVIVNDIPLVNPGLNDTVCISDQGFYLQHFSPFGGVWSGTGIQNASGLFSPRVAGSGEFPLSYYYIDPATGCDDSQEILMVVGALPVMGFEVDDIVCSNQLFSAHNTTVGAVSYSWQFGDNADSESASPMHSYDTSGYYSILLEARTMYGCIDSLRYSIEAIHPPIAKFAVDNKWGCAPLEVALTNSSLAKYETYVWDFGNGESSNEYAPDTVLYYQGLEDTAYYISLMVENQCGVDIALDTVTVFPVPIVNFAIDSSLQCSPAPIGLLDKIIGMPDTMLWQFGDGSVDFPSIRFNNRINHDYFFYGIRDTLYTITLRAWNECGEDSSSKPVRIRAKDVVAFFNTDTLLGCSPLSVRFINDSYNADIFHWDFGDGNVDNSFNTQHTFQNAGEYIVQLSVDNGCSFDTIQSPTIVVRPGAEPDFSFTDSVCHKEKVVFSNETEDFVSLTWDFGDSSGLTSLTNPEHLYDSAGVFIAKLTATNSFECTDSTEKPIHVIFNPTAYFTLPVEEGCHPFTAVFENRTDSVNYNTYIWNFNNGRSSVLINPPNQTFVNFSHCEDSIYTIQLIAEHGVCIDTFYRQLTVNPVPESSFGSTDSIYCAFGGPFNKRFRSDAVCADAVQWSVNGSVASTDFNPTLAFPEEGTYEVSQRATNQYFCNSSSAKTFTVFQPKESLIDVLGPEGCEPLRVQFLSISEGIAFHWYLGDGEESESENPIHTYKNKGEYMVKAVVTGAGNCVYRM